jgi:hypothetical protein
MSHTEQHPNADLVFSHLSPNNSQTWVVGVTYVCYPLEFSLEFWSERILSQPVFGAGKWR